MRISSQSAVPPSNRQLSAGRALLAGLSAGGLAAIAASLASLALRSPDPVIVNSASSTVLILLAGLAAGLAYQRAAAHRAPVRDFAIWIALAFAVVVAVALLAEAAPGHPFPHVATYCIPLAALALVLLGLLTPIFARFSRRPALIGPLLGAAALAVGVLLAGKGQTARGGLSLPASHLQSQTGSGPLQAKDVAGLAFMVDPSQSKATYTVREHLAELPLPSDAVGTTSQVSGTIFLDGTPSTVSVDVRTFKSDQPTRDSHLLRDPGLARFDPARFTTGALDLPGSYKPGDTINRQVQGTMTINNIEKPMTFAVEARLQDNTLFIHGASDFTWKDFNITPPTFSGVLQIADTIHAEILLVAKAQS